MSPTAEVCAWLHILITLEAADHTHTIYLFAYLSTCVSLFVYFCLFVGLSFFCLSASVPAPLSLTPTLPPSSFPLSDLGDTNHHSCCCSSSQIGFEALLSLLPDNPPSLFALLTLCSLCVQEKDIRAMEAEVLLLRSLSHPNIVQYLGSDRAERFTILLEYVPGGSIAMLLSQFGALEEEVVKLYVRQALLGLQYLHGEDIVHRDIKGANILISDKGDVKLTDFGCSYCTHLSEGLGMGLAMGTVLWMAPEVCRQEACEWPCDIWSMGCTVLQMVMNEAPWSERLFEHPVPAFFHIATCVEPPNIPDSLSEPMRDFIQCCLQLDATQRPSCTALLDMEWLCDDPSNHSSSGPSTPRWSRTGPSSSVDSSATSPVAADWRPSVGSVHVSPTAAGRSSSTGLMRLSSTGLMRSSSARGARNPGRPPLQRSATLTGMLGEYRMASTSSLVTPRTRSATANRIGDTRQLEFLQSKAKDVQMTTRSLRSFSPRATSPDYHTTGMEELKCMAQQVDGSPSYSSNLSCCHAPTLEQDPEPQIHIMAGSSAQGTTSRLLSPRLTHRATRFDAFDEPSFHNLPSISSFGFQQSMSMMSVPGQLHVTEQLGYLHSQAQDAQKSVSQVLRQHSA